MFRFAEESKRTEMAVLTSKNYPARQAVQGMQSKRFCSFVHIVVSSVSVWYVHNYSVVFMVEVLLVYYCVWSPAYANHSTIFLSSHLSHLPTLPQYFTTGRKGGGAPLVDFCPIFQVTHSHSLMHTHTHTRTRTRTHTHMHTHAHTHTQMHTHAHTHTQYDFISHQPTGRNCMVAPETPPSGESCD